MSSHCLGIAELTQLIKLACPEIEQDTPVRTSLFDLCCLSSKPVIRIRTGGRNVAKPETAKQTQTNSD